MISVNTLFFGRTGFLILSAGLAACGGGTTQISQPCPQPAEVTVERTNDPTAFSESDLAPVVAAITASVGKQYRKRIEQGVAQVANKWRETDGSLDELKAFCQSAFLPNASDRSALLARFESNLEQIKGHLHEMDLHLRAPTDLDMGPIAPIDYQFADFDLFTHLLEDLYASKVAFSILMNFEIVPLEEKLAKGADWTREQWAAARATDMFRARVPVEITKQIALQETESSQYIDSYNIHMHHVLTKEGNRLFPAGTVLITHWGLRDELKSHYNEPAGLDKQRLIFAVMNQIISQDIPAAVIDNPFVDWTPATGTVAPSAIVDQDADGYEGKKSIPAVADREPDTRYRHLLNTYRAARLADPYYPDMPTHIARKFNRDREIPEADVRKLFQEVLTAPVFKEVGSLIAKRIGRPLEPFDIWYTGFRNSGGDTKEKLNALVAKRYPTVASFQLALPTILGGLGFDRPTAAFLAAKIQVDPARGAGHASEAMRKEGNARLRTRIPASGMDYLGYNIAIHELGHNVEQVFSLNKMDHYLLAGVPNTAFTEGFAFAFQANDLALLGIKKSDRLAESAEVLSAAWSTFEMAGVALLDMELWQWMYDHPQATPAELRVAVLSLAVDIWNTYYAPVFGVRDQTFLAIYSHIIAYGMYTPDYTLGYLIQTQMQEYFKKNGLAKEMERMCIQGSITPKAWMQSAVGTPIDTAPLLRAAEAAVAAFGKK